MVYDSQKLRRKRVEQLEHNETFEPDFVQISKSYIHYAPLMMSQKVAHSKHTYVHPVCFLEK